MSEQASPNEQEQYDGSMPLARTKHERLCIEYVKDLCRNAACRRAGYSPRQGKDIWKRPEVLARIAYLVQERERESRVKAFRVLDELATVALSNIDHYEIDSETGEVRVKPGAPENALAAIASIRRTSRKNREGVTTREVEIRLWDKNTALTNALKHTGQLPADSAGANVTVNNNVQVAASPVVELTPVERERRLRDLGFSRLGASSN